MAPARQPRQQFRRAARLALVVAGHAAVLWLLLQPLPLPVRAPEPALLVTDIPLPPPPAPAPEATGAAALPAPHAEPQPRATPPPDIPTPVVAPVPLPPVPALGPDTAAGASDADAGGSGAGGSGAGLGAGGSGSGSGGGTPPKRIKGDIRRGDFPRVPADAVSASHVIIRLQVGADGRVHGCAVLQSSGNAARDTITCRLASKRFRYAPARNAKGDAVDGIAGWRQDWFPR